MVTSVRRYIAVSGYRNYKNWRLVFETLAMEFYNVDLSFPSVELLIGDCNLEEGPGADFYAYQYYIAKFNKEPWVFKADWEKYKKRAGPIRNREMIDSGVKTLYAFPDDRSKGTIGCVEYAVSKGVEVIFPEMEWRFSGKKSAKPEWFKWAKELKNDK